MSNHLKLRWLKTVVVSVEEKASNRRQVGTGKAARGTLASSSATAAAAVNGTLEAWGSVHAAAVAGANSIAGTGLSLIQSKKLMGWGVPSFGDMMHDGFMQEFGWEFLAG